MAAITQRFLDLARQVRRETEVYASRYHHPSDLMGLCVISSAWMMLEAKRAGYQDLAVGINRCHGFMIHRDHVVDLTATQFGQEFDCVTVLPLAAAEKQEEFWAADETFDCIHKLYQYQCRMGWPTDQLVRKETVRDWKRLIAA